MSNDDGNSKARSLANTKYFPYVRNAVLGLAAAISALVFCNSISNAGYSVIVSEDVILGRSLFYTVGVVLVIFVFNILSMYFVYHYFDNVDLFSKREYFHRGKSEALFFRIEHLIPFVISLCFAPFVFSMNINTLFSLFWPAYPRAIGNLLSFLLFVGIRFFQIRSLRERWDNEMEFPGMAPKPLFARNADMEKFTLPQLIWQPIGTMAILFLISLVASYVYLVIYIVINVILSLIEHPVWGVWIIVGILIIAGIPFSISAIHNTRVRLRLLRRLKKIQNDSIADIEYEGHKFASAFFPSLVFNLYITRKSDGKMFNVCVVSGGKMGAPMFFREDKFLVEHGFSVGNGALMARGGSYAVAVDISSFGGRENPTNMAFGYRKSFDLTFAEREGEKILLINPTPSKVFFMHGNLCFPIDNGMKIFDYSIYTASAFENMVREEYEI